MDLFFYSQAGCVIGDTPCRHIPIDSHDLLDRLMAEQELSHERLRYAYEQICFYVNGRISQLREETAHIYRAFNPDQQNLMFRSSGRDNAAQERLIELLERMLAIAKFETVDPEIIQQTLTEVSPLGLNLHIHLKDFELLKVYARDSGVLTEWRRDWRQMARKVRLEVPVYRRLVLAFKLKCQEDLIRDLIVLRGVKRPAAVRRVRKLYRHLPRSRHDQYLYLKLFKDTPKADLEMLLPNRGVRMKLFDRLKLGATSVGGIAAGAFTLIKKVLFATFHPIAFVIALGGLSSAVMRGVMRYIAQRNAYLKYLSERLYFHNLCNNRSVIGRIAERAAEELGKEALLAYFLVYREHKPAPAEQDALAKAMTAYIQDRFGVEAVLDATGVVEILQETGLLLLNQPTGERELSSAQPEKNGLPPLS